MWPLPVIERARWQDSKVGPPSSPCGVAAAFTEHRVLRKVSQLNNPHDLLIDEETWQAIGDPATADSIAYRLFALKEAIDSGTDGAKEASAAVLAEIEAAYLHTDAHGAALRLYLLSLTGRLKPEDEPVRLINGAIERGAAAADAARGGRATEKRRG